MFFEKAWDIPFPCHETIRPAIFFFMILVIIQQKKLIYLWDLFEKGSWKMLLIFLDIPTL